MEGHCTAVAAGRRTVVAAGRCTAVAAAAVDIVHYFDLTVEPEFLPVESARRKVKHNLNGLSLKPGAIQ